MILAAVRPADPKSSALARVCQPLCSRKQRGNFRSLCLGYDSGGEQRSSKTRGIGQHYIHLVSGPETAMTMSSADGGLTLHLTSKVRQRRFGSPRLALQKRKLPLLGKHFGQCSGLQFILGSAWVAPRDCPGGEERAKGEGDGKFQAT